MGNLQNSADFQWLVVTPKGHTIVMEFGYGEWHKTVVLQCCIILTPSQSHPKLFSFGGINAEMMSVSGVMDILCCELASCWYILLFLNLNSSLWRKTELKKNTKSITWAWVYSLDSILPNNLYHKSYFRNISKHRLLKLSKPNLHTSTSWHKKIIDCKNHRFPQKKKTTYL